ncbi:hypothetical protein BEN49_22820 [Hymenobacter coccineus]|uniref:Uncharacterized protein n=1 Tax=Hymenobacter coccineus TaxID=1908235 RepID=A0A1G1THS6_9BACT|nr:hypothetical protein BEN49_22820 [Hymenobacter coccineus]
MKARLYLRPGLFFCSADFVVRGFRFVRLVIVGRPGSAADYKVRATVVPLIVQQLSSAADYNVRATDVLLTVE